MTTFDAFADDAASLGIGELTLENGRERVAVYGGLDLTRDKAGLKCARDLNAVLDAVVRHLEAARDLPDAVPAPEPPTSVENPFGRRGRATPSVSRFGLLDGSLVVAAGRRARRGAGPGRLGAPLDGVGLWQASVRGFAHRPVHEGLARSTPGRPMPDSRNSAPPRREVRGDTPARTRVFQRMCPCPLARTST